MQEVDGMSYILFIYIFINIYIERESERTRERESERAKEMRCFKQLKDLGWADASIHADSKNAMGRRRYT